MSKKQITSFVCAIGLCIVGGLAIYSYLTPDIAFKNIRTAALEGDNERLHELIDFHSVRAGLKEDLKSQFMTEMHGQIQGNPFAALGVAMVNMMIDPLVDAVASPSGITAFVEGRVRPLDEGGRTEPSMGSGDDEYAQGDVNIDAGYVSYSRYRVRLKVADKDSLEMSTFSLRRAGLFSWKLARVSLPKGMFARPPQESVSPAEATASDEVAPTKPKLPAKPISMPRIAKPSIPSGPFVISVGAYPEPGVVLDKLRAESIPYYTEAIVTAGGTITRVRAGPFDDQQTAELTRTRIAALGMKPGLVVTKDSTPN